MSTKTIFRVRSIKIVIGEIAVDFQIGERITLDQRCLVEPIFAEIQPGGRPFEMPCMKRHVPFAIDPGHRFPIDRRISR